MDAGTFGLKGALVGSAAEKLERLYATHADAGFRLALLLSGSEDRAQDLVQEAFVRAASRLGSLRHEDRFRGYLLKTIVNLARSSWRKKVPQVPPPQPTIQPDVAARDEMLSVLMTLPLRQRSAIYFRYYLDLSESDTADALGCSMAAAKSLIHRALTTLRENLEVPR